MCIFNGILKSYLDVCGLELIDIGMIFSLFCLQKEFKCDWDEFKSYLAHIALILHFHLIFHSLKINFQSTFIHKDPTKKVFNLAKWIFLPKKLFPKQQQTNKFSFLLKKLNLIFTEKKR